MAVSIKENMEMSQMDDLQGFDDDDLDYMDFFKDDELSPVTSSLVQGRLLYPMSSLTSLNTSKNYNTLNILQII